MKGTPRIDQTTAISLVSEIALEYAQEHKFDKKGFIFKFQNLWWRVVEDDFSDIIVMLVPDSETVDPEAESNSIATFQLKFRNLSRVEIQTLEALNYW